MPITSPTLFKSILSEDPKGGQTFEHQDVLPKLPIPDLNATAQKYLCALEPLLTPDELEETKSAVEEFLEKEGPELQARLCNYASDKSSYIEEFWYDSYLKYTDPVVLNLNPFFLLEDDPTPQRNNQIIRASSLIYSTATFIEALSNKTLKPDVFRGTPLCMSQFGRLFATARVPTKEGCYIVPSKESKHIVVMAKSQFYHFDVLNDQGHVAVTEKDIAANLKAIEKDAIQATESAVGVLTTENRLNWAKLRETLESDPANNESLSVIDTALFVVCLDHVEPADINELSTNMLCGTYKLVDGMQVGTCTNRWYDKLQIIVCKNGSAGINFEHTGVDGHTVLRYVSDIYTDTILRFAKTINSQTKSIFHSYSPQQQQQRQQDNINRKKWIDMNPRKIEWHMTEPLKLGIRFAETRLSDLILQNECKVLEFNQYGKYFITDMKMSPDAFVQMAFQAAYYGLYGKSECTYEPAMTKTFLHGRTEAIRSVSSASKHFVETYYSSKATTLQKLEALRAGLKYHTGLTRECSKGLGQDRHLYALECVWNRLYKSEEGQHMKKPRIFTDMGWKVLNHTVISTSNCGNPALRLFGFGPTVSDGFGIGYIIKEDGIAFVASSKHRQTQRFLDTLNKFLIDIQGLLLKEKYPTGLSQRQRVLALEEAELEMNGYGYFDNGEDQSSDNSSQSSRRRVGKRLVLHKSEE